MRIEVSRVDGWCVVTSSFTFIKDGADIAGIIELHKSNKTSLLDWFLGWPRNEIWMAESAGQAARYIGELRFGTPMNLAEGFSFRTETRLTGE